MVHYCTEEKIRELEAELEEKDRIIAGLSAQIDEIKSEAEVKTEYLVKMNDDIAARYKKASSDYLDIQNSSSWKMTEPFRKTETFFRKFFIRHYKLRVFFLLVVSFFCFGLSKAKNKYRELKIDMPFRKLQSLGFDISADSMLAQKETDFNRSIKISILVPLFNNNVRYIKKMIDSVKDQTYSDWELIIADYSEKFKTVKRICEKKSKKDNRIKYVKPSNDFEKSDCTIAYLRITAGDYVTLLEPVDLLHPYALFEVMNAICKTDADFIYTDENTFIRTPEDANAPYYKPDFSSDSLCGKNYIGHLAVFKRSLLDETNALATSINNYNYYDLILKLTEKANTIMHIPEVLYFCRVNEKHIEQEWKESTETDIKAIEEHVRRLGLEGNVTLINQDLSVYKVQYLLKNTPKVSILIPNCEHLDDLKKCIESIYSKTSYQNFEIVIIENNSSTKSVFDFYKKLQTEHNNLKLITWNEKFNYSAINNFGAKNCDGDYLLFLNNDTVVISSDWIEQMLMYAQRDDVGAVGAKLYYPDDTIQHAGLGLGLLGLAGHFFRGVNRYDTGYMGRLLYAQNVSAVTGACMLVSRKMFDETDGFDESLEVAFNDVDLCMKVRSAGYLIVWTPFAELYHCESKSRGADDTPEKKKRFEEEVIRFNMRWKTELAAGDPYYNKNLTLDKEDFSIAKQ